MEWNRDDLTFSSDGVSCAAWLYRPTGVERPPVVVMAHGFAGTRNVRLDAFAERFAQRGMAAFVFDYRHFGDSQGEPRQLLDIPRQLADWRAALNHVRGLDAVDGERLALWGTSFSGGHVVVTAAADPAVRAVVAQVPFVDGRARGEITPGLGIVLRMMAAAVRDVVGARLGLAPQTIPVIGEPGSYALLNTPGSMDLYQKMLSDGVEFCNEVAARVLLSVPGYRPVLSAEKVQCPLLLVPARGDNLVPLEAVETLAARAPQAKLKVMECGHFDVYLGDLFEEVAAYEADFLLQHLDSGVDPR